MADNIGYTPGTGATVAADEIAGVLFQRVKPTFGVDGVAVDVSSSNPLPVQALTLPLPSSGTQVAASEESIILLRRMVKLLESQNATDIGNRQRVTIDAGTLPTVTTVTAVTTVATVSAITAGTITNVQQLAGADQRQFIDVSRTNYNTGIRSRLTFT